MRCHFNTPAYTWDICLHFINTLRPRRNKQHFADDIFKCIFFNENVWISIKISPKFVPKGPINNIPALVQIMAWRRSGASHYLNQWWLVYWCISASLGLNELRDPDLGWLYVFSSFPLAHLHPLPLQWRLLLTSKPFELDLKYLGQRKYRSGTVYWMTFYYLHPRSRLWHW